MTNLKLKELFLAVVRRPNFGWRTLIMFVSISLAVSVYTFLVDFYDPEINILSRLNVFPKKQEIFSGSPGGFYVSVGAELSNEMNGQGKSVSLINRETAGGYENAINVLVTPNSYGLVQEETIHRNDFIRDHVNYITPLYMERMHILYRYDRIKYKNTIVLDNGMAKPELKVSAHLTDNAKYFFANAHVSTGPVGSSGRIVASYILSHISTSAEEIKKA